MIKKILLTLALVLFTLPAFGAVDDGITLTGCTAPKTGKVRICTIAWANDTGTDIGPTAINITAGTIIRVDFIPDATNAPTAAYDAFVYESATAAKAADLTGGTGADLSATVTSVTVPDLGDSAGGLWHSGTVYPFVSGLTNANDDEGEIIIYVYVGN